MFKSCTGTARPSSCLSPTTTIPGLFSLLFQCWWSTLAKNISGLFPHLPGLNTILHLSFGHAHPLNKLTLRAVYALPSSSLLLSLWLTILPWTQAPWYLLTLPSSHQDSGALPIFFPTEAQEFDKMESILPGPCSLKAGKSPLDWNPDPKKKHSFIPSSIKVTIWTITSCPFHLTFAWQKWDTEVGRLHAVYPVLKPASLHWRKKAREIM